MISDNQEMAFRVELLIRSIKKFSNQPTTFSVIVNGTENKPLTLPLNLTVGTIGNKYVADNAEIHRCPYHWLIPAPSRWFIKPKSDPCIFIDADMIACRDLTPIYNLSKDYLHGVTALNSHLNANQWKSLGMESSDLERYFNFGMLVIPNKYMIDIGTKMFDHIQKITSSFPEHQYFAGQIALACTLKELKVPLNVLPKKFNWYDLLPPQNLEEILFLHYMSNQRKVLNETDACMISGNPYAKLISETAKSIYRRKIFI